MKWVLLLCFACTTGWAFQDFHNKTWTPNERTFTGILLGIIVLFETIAFTKPSIILASYLMMFNMIAVIVVVVAETCFDFRHYHAINKNRDNSKHN